MAITPLPPAPLPSDTPSEFNAKAFDLVAALEDFVTETNATAVAVDADATSADADAATATTKANEASASADLAEDWATKTTGTVDGTEFSAKKYAQDSSDSADESAASAVEAAGLVENYQGALASDPSLNKDGGALQAGDWYVNTSTGLIRAYTGSVWVTSVNITAGVSSFSAGSTGLTPGTGTQGDITLSGTLSVANGGTGASTLAGANIALTNIANTFTGNQTFSGTSSNIAAILTNAAEVCTVSATAATGTIAFYPSTQSVLYYTSNASGNWTVNHTFSSGTTLNTALTTGQSITVAFLVTQGATAYYNSSVQVDGTTSGVTTRWQGGAPTKGNASGVDIYTYTIVKTGSATFTVFASQTQFKD